MVKKKTKKAKCLWQKRILTRVEFVDTITGMCERLVESDLLERDDLADLEEGLAEDDLTAERLTDLFCDAIEVIDANKMSGELDADVADFYEDAPWNELPDEDEEEEVSEEQQEEEVKKEEKKPKQKSKPKKSEDKPKTKPKKQKAEKKSTAKKTNKAKEQKTTKKKQTKQKDNKPSKKQKTDHSKSNKAIVYLAWDDGEGITDVSKLHKKVKQAVKETTIKGWLNAWKNGKNLPAIVKE